MSEIPTSRQIEEVEAVLRSDTDPNHRKEALATLARWQLDERLDAGLRQKVQLLVQKFLRFTIAYAAGMSKIDVSQQVAEMECVLRSNPDSARRREALAILSRWQFDEMLDDASRKKARALVREFRTPRAEGPSNS